MSDGMDLSQFYDTFFEEAEELLADMEQSLISLDVESPDKDDLNSIFRAAHSIKGGAATFGTFERLAQTTHLLENILDALRNDELVLQKEMVDVFLETKDVLLDQIHAYRESGDADEAVYEHISAKLNAIMEGPEKKVLTEDAKPEVKPAPDLAPESIGQGADKQHILRIEFSNIDPEDSKALENEMAIMGEIIKKEDKDNGAVLWVKTDESAEDIGAVCCFVINENQLSITAEDLVDEPQEQAIQKTPTIEQGAEKEKEVSPAPVKKPLKPKKREVSSNASASTTLRVAVDKVDQIINLVGELVITQSMLLQTTQSMDPVEHERLIQSVEQLQRNMNDLQESVMSIRMMPMDYVFSRFPRVVRESAGSLNKKIRLITHGQSTELDKSLIERIIDPLTHLVRNSIDHGIEKPEVREAAGKNPEGTITLSAEHSGGHIVIEVADDGAGMNRERILAKAMEAGFPVSESTPDDELWQYLFAPGFSTAEKVTEISGRGVGMDVVRRNIQDMGGYIHISSTKGQGSTTRIVLPLTLAIMEGMSVEVGQETFILPFSHIVESLQATPDQLRRISETETVLCVRDEYLPFIRLGDVFNVDGFNGQIEQGIVVILKEEDRKFALLVDHLVGQHQVVVKNLESNYRKVQGISAATIMGDGRVALIVDVFALMAMAGQTKINF